MNPVSVQVKARITLPAVIHALVGSKHPALKAGLTSVLPRLSHQPTIASYQLVHCACQGLCLPIVTGFCSLITLAQSNTALAALLCRHSWCRKWCCLFCCCSTCLPQK